MVENTNSNITSKVIVGADNHPLDLISLEFINKYRIVEPKYMGDCNENVDSVSNIPIRKIKINNSLNISCTHNELMVQHAIEDNMPNGLSNEIALNFVRTLEHVNYMFIELQWVVKLNYNIKFSLPEIFKSKTNNDILGIQVTKITKAINNSKLHITYDVNSQSSILSFSYIIELNKTFPNSRDCIAILTKFDKFVYDFNDRVSILENVRL